MIKRKEAKENKKGTRPAVHTMSVPKSMHKMVMVPSGKGMPSKMNMRKGDISGMFELSVYAIDFFKLSKIKRPSSTPVTMDAKLSSNKIISAACFETSEPAIPMATPAELAN